MRKSQKLKNIEKSKMFRRSHLLKNYFNQWSIKHQEIQYKIYDSEDFIYQKQLNIKIKVFIIFLIFFPLLYIYNKIK